MKKTIIVISLFLFFCINLHAQAFRSNKDLKFRYIQLSGNLFKDVQLAAIFKDSKTFVDAVPLKEPEQILKLYNAEKNKPDFDLHQFVYANFKIPGERQDTIKLSGSQSMEGHIDSLWKYLIRQPDEKQKYSTLIPLKFKYVVPGGRFREIYYWDSFFSMLGLLAGGRIAEAESMVKNFAYILDKYKMIPNGSRIYYLTRSQPPFFALMVDIICRYKNDYTWGLQFLDQLQTEYAFWMYEDSGKVPGKSGKYRVIRLGKKDVLNRYYDFDNVPREESFKEDYLQGQKISDNLRPEFYKNLRAAAESGWDFSSRWFKDEKTLGYIQTTDILPVDLNSLLYFLEDRLSFFYKLKNNSGKSKLYAQKAAARAALLNKYFWNGDEGFFVDYNWKTGTQTKVLSLAGLYPLYFGIAKPGNAVKASGVLKEKFLKPGGLVTTLNETGQQWDAPNGWPPLQWMAIKGLREYRLNVLADTIRSRWLRLNESVYKRTGKMLEKYNVENISLFGGGGEYPLQDGFGWTNGVASALLNNFDRVYLFKK